MTLSLSGGRGSVEIPIKKLNIIGTYNSRGGCPRLEFPTIIYCQFVEFSMFLIGGRPINFEFKCPYRRGEGSRLIQLLFFILIVRFCSNSWTWEGHILGLFNFDLLYFLIENDFDYTVFKIDIVQVSGITRILGF